MNRRTFFAGLLALPAAVKAEIDRQAVSDLIAKIDASIDRITRDRFKAGSELYLRRLEQKYGLRP